MTATPHNPLNPPDARRARVPKLALTVAEAAEAVGLGERSIELLIQAKQIGVVRVGRRVLIPTAALRKWIEASTEGGLE